MTNEPTVGPGIRADSFSFEYSTEPEPALDDVSFEVRAGEVLGVLGPVEAGKTTLSMAMASFAPQNTGGSTSGELTVAGRDPQGASDNAVAMVFEDYTAQLTQVRVLDEVMAPLVNRGRTREDARARARDLLDRVRLLDDAEKYTWDLSGGQQQRLAIAAALAIDPEVMVFDTATDMLDPEGREDVANLVASMAGSQTLVVTAHDADELVGVADRVLVLEDGETVRFGPADDVLRDHELLRGVGIDPPLCLAVAEGLGLDADPLTPQELLGRLDEAAMFGPSETAATTSADGGEATAGDGGGAAADGGACLRTNRATYEYADGTVAVDGVDVDVHDGEVHAVVGANGAGKSTFSKLLVGLLAPDAGHVQVEGTTTTDVPYRELATAVGVALQNPDEQISERTVDEELRFPLERRQYRRHGFLGLRTEQRYDDDYVDRRVEAVRDLVGIDDEIREADPMFLPRGQKRLVTIGLAVASDPDAVVLDEPTAGLDAASRETVVDTIDRLAADGTAVVLIDHDMDFVCEVADRVTVLHDGAAVEQGPTEEVFDGDRWEELAAYHVRPPRVATLARELGLCALTVDGLVDELAAVIEEPA
jgi:energy-coupling factor transport system ATP-binding protein